MCAFSVDLSMQELRDSNGNVPIANVTFDARNTTKCSLYKNTEANSNLIEIPTSLTKLYKYNRLMLAQLSGTIEGGDMLKIDCSNILLP